MRSLESSPSPICASGAVAPMAAARRAPVKAGATLAVAPGMKNEGLVQLFSSVNCQYLTVYEAG
jgi:hypothetical protein